MLRIEQKENTLAAIELVVKEFLSDDVIGKWFSVKERSLGNIMRQVNLDISYSQAIYQELRNIGMIEKEGDRVHMRYKIVTNLIPDIKVVAERIYDNHRKSRKPMVFESRKGDCVPPKKKKNKTIEDWEINDSKKSIINKKGFVRIPRLGEIVYTIVNGLITEARIVCVRFNEDDKVLVSFTTPIITKDENGLPINVKREDCCLRNIAFSVEELMRRLQNNIQKF